MRGFRVSLGFVVGLEVSVEYCVLRPGWWGKKGMMIVRYVDWWDR